MSDQSAPSPLERPSQTVAAVGEVVRSGDGAYSLFIRPSLHYLQDAMEMPPLWKSANNRGFPQGFGTLRVPHSHSDSHHLFSSIPN